MKPINYIWFKAAGILISVHESVCWKSSLFDEDNKREEDKYQNGRGCFFLKKNKKMYW